jgi:hypothetical protein
MDNTTDESIADPLCFAQHVQRIDLTGRTHMIALSNNGWRRAFLFNGRNINRSLGVK